MIFHGHRPAFLAILLLGSAPAFGATDQDRFLWRIGQSDDGFAELALAPNDYRDFGRDPLFLVGASRPEVDWPYCHPGPADFWADGRAHTFTILFALAQAPSAPSWDLVVDLVDTHGALPPRLRVVVNGWETVHAMPPGAGDASIFGDAAAGREHGFSVSIPFHALQEGLNEIVIENTAGSWVLYDSVALVAPSNETASLATGTLVRSVQADPWLARRDGELWQPLSVELVHFGPPTEATVTAEGTTSGPHALAAGLQAFELALPQPGPATRASGEVRVTRGDEVLCQAPFLRPRARIRRPVDYVDPMIGTATSRWMLYPGPSTPFSMVKLSPDNQRHCWKAGYEYTIDNIAGFSHLHSWTMGGLLTVPTSGKLEIVPGPEDDPDAGYRSRHSTEIAWPGYYRVRLDDTGIRVELTSTARAGFQRYRFERDGPAWILFDLLTPTEYNYEVLEARITRVSDREIEGFSKQRGATWASWNDYTIHFVARLDRPMQSFGGWVEGEMRRDVEEITGQGDVGAFLGFSPKAGDVIQMQTGISMVSVEQARLNLETEMDPFRWDFGAAYTAARDTWSELLRLLEVEGGTEADKVKFYTNLYRAYCSRTILSDVNGQYVDMYENVQQVEDPDSPVYGCDAFWNTFWNLNQLWTLITPEVTSKWVHSLLEIADKGGWLAKGPAGIEYSSIMVASHEIALIVAAWQAGIRDFDAEQAWQAMRFIQTEPGRPHPGGGHVGNRQLEPYLRLGYVPVEAGPVSNTLEYAYDDWCVAQMARALGKEDDAREFTRRAGFWRNVFDPEVGYARQRHEDGRWVEDFSPFSGAGFVEGNSWQYTWFVPQDVPGLIEALGRDEFNGRLEQGFRDSVRSDFNATGDRFADFPINHGNQPNMQAAWLFNWSGKPWLTQHWTREILDRYYGTGPLDGWPGDEDQGQMGAWFVMAAMGLFQMDGGCSVEPFYEIGSPLFEKVTIHLDERYYPGGTFVIEARGSSRENRYVQSATLDGEPLERPWFHQSRLVDGGRLVLEMGPEPNEVWGSAPEAAPPSSSD